MAQKSLFLRPVNHVVTLQIYLLTLNLGTTDSKVETVNLVYMCRLYTEFEY